MNRTAVIAGSTGLVGGSLLRQLLVDTSFSKVISISRRDSGVKHDKLVEYTGSLEDPVFLEKHIKGDVIFCCLGTTIKKAGS
ncbi:MAG: oxidoreductase, partial [Bacteroidales bacterium]|nr:oxidoreductase [Bacteroidales bacterium]